jgi:hypothetical protein
MTTRMRQAKPDFVKFPPVALFALDEFSQRSFSFLWVELCGNPCAGRHNDLASCEHADVKPCLSQ